MHLTEASTISTPRSADQGTTETGYGSRSYRNYILGILLTVYIFNFIDRTIINILTEPIKESFGVEDWQMGLLGGPAFAILYTFVGIPIARFSEKHHRVWIIAGSVALWSLMTALCGFATSFIALFIFRIGVSIGEAGCSPPANSLIADYFVPAERSTAVSVYALGIPLGGMVAYVFGGYIVGNLDGPIVGAMLSSWNWTWAANALDWQNIEGWRVAFVVVGVPGIIVAMIVKMTIQEPPRGYTDPAEMQNKEQVGFREVLRILSKKPSYWHVTLGVTIASFVNYGVGQFFVSFLIRTHEMSIFDASVKIAMALALMAAIGTYMSGYLADKYAQRFPKALALIPMFALIGVIPLHVTGYLAESLWLAVPLMMVGQMLLYTYLCPLYAVPSGVVDSRMRATAVAVTLFIVNLLGYGLGPPLIGGLSTILNATFLSGLDPALTLEACKASNLAAAAQSACETANADGLRWSMVLFKCLYLWAIFHFYMASRTIQRDMGR
ncbi:MAG: MFS transporter [Sphingomonadales bacterium]|nr:MFS transporter [Sphingomonadales bacterium]NCO49991.1 MFS transporter [Sphingomonadales bacterium]NCP00454.1 MFS transporter [Sphingomonadales bacterium]NCP26692.1 MFS transporter [Sphingomonadales bacterium]NCP43384.1 MFS transporter [Sphingomonadales bacterium]